MVQAIAKKPTRFIVECEFCGEPMEYFAGLEILKMCDKCREEYRAFQRWEKKHGTFAGWVDVYHWERRYDA